jgi:hypothetical protein
MLKLRVINKLTIQQDTPGDFCLVDPDEILGQFLPLCHHVTRFCGD